MAGLVRQQERSVARERAAQRRRRRARRRHEPRGDRTRRARRGRRARGPGARRCCAASRTTRCASSPRDRPARRRRARARAGDRRALLGAPRTTRRAACRSRPSARADLRAGADDCGRRARRSVRAERRGLLVVRAARRRPRRDARRCRRSPPRSSLALESAALTEEVHRRASEARFGSLVQHVERPHHRARRRRDGSSTRARRSSACSATRPTRSSARASTSLLPPGDAGRLLQLLDDAAAYAAPRHGRSSSARCATATASARHFEILHTNLLDDEHVRGIVLNGRDVSERKAFEEQLAHQAFHDPVTGLAEPRAVRRARAPRGRPRAAASDSGLAVIFLDLDDFKTINDSLGHAAGDEVLLEVGQAPGARASAPATPPRASAATSSPCCSRTSRRARRRPTPPSASSRRSPLPLRARAQGARRCAPASASRSSTARRAADADELIRNADAAMYIAKRDGKGGYRLFEPAMHEGVLARLELRADLQRAIDERPVRAALPAGRAPRRRPRRRASRRCCAGATPSAASSRRTSSSRSPRRPA